MGNEPRAGRLVCKGKEPSLRLKMYMASKKAMIQHFLRTDGPISSQCPIDSISQTTS
jgi:hypothetical protein